MKYKISLDKELNYTVENTPRITICFNKHLNKKILSDFIKALEVLREDNVFFRLLFLHREIIIFYNYVPKNRNFKLYNNYSLKQTRKIKKIRKDSYKNILGIYKFDKIYVINKKSYIGTLYHEIGHVIYHNLCLIDKIKDFKEIMEQEKQNTINELKFKYKNKRILEHKIRYVSKDTESFARLFSLYYSVRFMEKYNNLKNKCKLNILKTEYKLLYKKIDKIIKELKKEKISEQIIKLRIKQRNELYEKLKMIDKGE